MDPVTVNPWISLALSAIALAGFIKGWISSGEKQNTEDINRLDESVADVSSRLQKVEGDLQHLPNRETTHRLELQLEKMNGRLEAMDERLKPVQAIGERLQELLVHQVKR